MRIFCSTCGHETEFTHHCSEHNGYEEAKRANAETESWKRRWASTQTKLNDLIEFYETKKIIWLMRLMSFLYIMTEAQRQEI